MTAVLPTAPGPIVIPRGRRSAAERRLAAIAALHQPVILTGPAAGLVGPGCGQCSGRWPCSTALLLGDWPQEDVPMEVAARITLPAGKSAAEVRLAAIAALHRPIPDISRLAVALGPSCRQCLCWPCATAQLLAAWPGEHERHHCA
jgi:hypothetical protein